MEISSLVLDNPPLLGLIPLAVLQLLFPRRKIGVLKSEWKADVGWLIYQNVFSVLLAMAGIDVFQVVAPKIHALARLPFHSFAVRLVTAAIAMDFLCYWWHRSLHRLKPLWAIHKLHHSSAQLTAISSNRSSVFEDFPLGMLSKTIPLRLLGFDWDVIFILNSGYDVFNLWTHSNLGFSPPILRDIFCMPNFHEWHHARENIYRDGQNFGIGSPVWDRIFGTSHRPPYQPASLGFEGMETKYPSSFLGRLIYPLNFDFISNPRRKGTSSSASG